MDKQEFYLSTMTGTGASITEDRVKKVLNTCRNRTAKKMLDIGCGDGGLTVLIKETLNAEEAFGVELSSEGISSSKEKGISCYSLDIDGAVFPFEDESFDYIFCGEIFEHLFDTDHLLDEIYRLLKSGAVCVFSVPNLSSFWNRMLLLLGYQPFYTSASLLNPEVGKLLRGRSAILGRDHVRLPTCKAFIELLEKHSLKLKRIQGARADTSSLTQPFRSLLSIPEIITAKIPSLSTRIIAEVEKIPRE